MSLLAVCSGVGSSVLASSWYTARCSVAWTFVDESTLAQDPASYTGSIPGCGGTSAISSSSSGSLYRFRCAASFVWEDRASLFVESPATTLGRVFECDGGGSSTLSGGTYLANCDGQLWATQVAIEYASGAVTGAAGVGATLADVFNLLLFAALAFAFFGGWATGQRR